MSCPRWVPGWSWRSPAKRPPWTRAAGMPGPAGLWRRKDQVTDRLTAYMARLPAGATREPLTGQQQLDAWARERTFGLIDRFPGEVTPDVLLVRSRAHASSCCWPVSG